MTQNEMNLASHFLGIASDEFSNHGCNDVEDSIWNDWTLSERKQFVKEFNDWNGSPDDYDENHLHLPDFALMGFLAFKLKNYEPNR